MLTLPGETQSNCHVSSMGREAAAQALAQLQGSFTSSPPTRRRAQFVSNLIRATPEEPSCKIRASGEKTCALCLARRSATAMSSA